MTAAKSAAPAPTRAQRVIALRNLKSVRLFIACSAPPDDPVLNQREIGKFAQIMLRIAHVALVSTAKQPEAPQLHINVKALRISDHYSIHLALELVERVWLVRPGAEEALDAPTWRASVAFSCVPLALRASLREHLGKLLAGFMNDFTEANRAQ